MAKDDDVKIFSVLGDSIAMVRPDDGLFERDLYSCKLQRKLGAEYCVVNRARVSNHAGWMVSEDATIYHVRGAKAEFFSIQIGVVDCAPRMFTEEEKRHLTVWSTYPIVGNIVRAWIRRQSKRRYEITQQRQIIMTRPEEFDASYRQLIADIRKYNPVKKIFVINVCFPGPYFVARNYGLEDSIRLFNGLLAKIVVDNQDVVRLVDVYAFTKDHPERLLPDGHHLDGAGHDFIADEIIRLMH